MRSKKDIFIHMENGETEVFPADIKSTVIKLKRELERMKVVPIDRI